MKISSHQFMFTTFLLLFSIALFAQEKGQTQHEKIEQTNLLLIEGGIFTMGQDVEGDIARKVTVSAFYIDATEVTNKEYRAFITYLEAQSSIYLNEMLPDTSIWTRCVGTEIGTQLVADYFRLPAFDYYPVVGVSWIQATAFSKWRSDRHNEQLAIEKGYWTADLQAKYDFSTSTFLAGNYHKKEGKKLPKDFNLLLPNYRLLSEAEWELAAWALIGKRELDNEGRISNQVYNPFATEGKDKHHKKAIDKYRKLVLQHARKNPLPSYYNTEKYNLPKAVFEGEINRYGIYNLNNNVAEWVQDPYRPIVKTTAVNPHTPAPKVKQGTNAGVDATRLRVVKGTSERDAKNKKSPGSRSSAKASGQYGQLIGFRCGMTMTEMPQFK
jgi:formylglycine-generating enzyme required for sulfatase activity